MMGWKLVAAAVCILAAQDAHAQAGMTKLTVPCSPAFSILNFEPTAVMHPTSNKDVATDILNAFDKNGKLLVNLGLEVSPYWLQSRPTLTEDKYLHPNPGQAFLQSFSISAATVKDSATGGSKLGAGFRFKLWNGRPVDELKAAQGILTSEQLIISTIATARAMVGSGINTRHDAIDFIAEALTDESAEPSTIDRFKTNAGEVAKAYSDAPSDIKFFLEKLISDRLDADGVLIKKVATLIKQREGFVLELAGASAFATGNQNNVEKIGLWLNISNYVSQRDLFSMTTRYMFKKKDTSLSNADMGLSYLRKTDKFNISVEAMLRWYLAKTPAVNASGEHTVRKETNFTYRVAIESSFMVSNDISVNLSIGKNFDTPFFSSTNFFSILGFNYSLFNKERVILK